MGTRRELKLCASRGAHQTSVEQNAGCTQAEFPLPPLLTGEWPGPPGGDDPLWDSRECGNRGARPQLFRAQQGATYTAPGLPRPRALICWWRPSLPAAASQSGLTSPLPGCVAWGGAKRRLRGVFGARRPPASALWKENWAPLTVNSATIRVTQLPLSPRPGVSAPAGGRLAVSGAALSLPPRRSSDARGAQDPTPPEEAPPSSAISTLAY